MHSSGDSNSVPARIPGTTWSSPISIHDSSETSTEGDGPLRFKVRLYAEYREYAVLPDLPTITGGDRWITVATEHGRLYKIEMVEDGGGFLLDRGWSLLVAIENLQQNQTLMFEQQDEDFFTARIHTPPDHPPPAGLSPGRIPSPDNSFGLTHLIVNSGTPMNDIVLHAIQRLWNASSINGPIYACRLVTNPLEANSMVFNEVYSNFIPEDHGNIAMTFVGSNTIIPGAMETYADRKTRIVKEWPLYAKEHSLTMGEIFVCKIHRGPTVWEFIGFCAGRQ